MMKKFLKTISVALIGGIFAASLTACAKTPTPAEVYQLVEDADSAKIVIKMELGELISVKATMKMEGDKAHVTSETTALGMSQNEEYYQLKDGDKIYRYEQDEDGNWVKTESEEEEDEDAISVYEELFDPENYKEFNKETRRYDMKDDVEVELDGMTCSDGYIEIGEDGTYTIYVEISREVMETKVEGSLKITISNIGEVSVKLPEVKSE